MHADNLRSPAATFTGSGTPRTASWALPVSTTGTYDVYARWVADPAHATNATYTVYYSGGTTPVSVNQTQEGGMWNLLGTFTLDPSLNPKVELSDQANGIVVADAVMVLPSGTSSDQVTYTPTLPSAGTFDIYVKWSESSTRAETVTYTIQHAGGSSEITVNQQQPSAGWFRLGAFSMTPGQNHRVEVGGALEGETVADAVRFVSAGTSAPGIHYVHADHLGSPQKMTDANQALVWDAVYTPFGQVHAITGTATTNQRFPGQYADAETGFNYNYFRDYDPTTGRYVQSDPIGLGGGLNTYAYVQGNPENFSDPLGLFAPPHHALATRMAARKAGCEVIADELAERTAGVDYEEGSQDPNNSYKHAMSDGQVGQDPGDAERQYLNYLSQNTQGTDLDTLAHALHGVQDSFSGGHAGFQSWPGLKWKYAPQIFWHFLKDLYSRYTSDFDAAVEASAGMIKEYKERNPCRCQ